MTNIKENEIKNYLKTLTVEEGFKAAAKEDILKEISALPITGKINLESGENWYEEAEKLSNLLGFTGINDTDYPTFLYYEKINDKEVTIVVSSGECQPPTFTAEEFVTYFSA